MKHSKSGQHLKNFTPTLLILLSLIILISIFLFSSNQFGYTGQATHLGGRPNALIAHLMLDGFTTNQYTQMSIINIAPVAQVVTLKFWNTTGGVVSSTTNTIQPNAQWLLSSAGGGGPGGPSRRTGYLTIEADDVLSLRAQVLIFFGSSGFPVTISSTSISPYGPASASTISTLPASSLDTTPPDTTIITTPPSTTSSTTFNFYFRSSETGSTFECSLDGGTFEVCTSPKRYTSLPRSTHTFSVRAKDPAGNFDLTPASFSWTIS
ncbi:MAG: hypothetical protein HYT73_02505 [Candidatus Aenigmarchaeota archaeon]|nr:hypothetical protein [Candidatus Aenigmarchaeota archaeon]